MKPTEPDTAVFLDDSPQKTTTIAPGEIVIGHLTGIDAKGQPLVDYPENPSTVAVVAMSTLGMTRQDIGREVALLFANGDPCKPVIMGMIHNPLHALLDSYQVSAGENTTLSDANQDDVSVADTQKHVQVDGKRVLIEGKEEIVLKCGDASITLTKAGKILIRGKYLLNRSSGLNRILGGAVQIN